MTLWFVIGTRPEMIKLAPVILAAKSKFEVRVFLTGQHPAVEAMAPLLGVTDTINLGLWCGSLNRMVMGILNSLECESEPDCVVVQGDTTSAMAAALWAFNRQIPVAHVEAGLRTYRSDPYPEEANRRIIASCATWHFAPTETAHENLTREGFLRVFTVGNTVIDALSLVPPLEFNYDVPTAVLTLHRRESWGEPMEQTLRGVLDWLDTTDMQVVWPVHPGGKVQNVAANVHHPRLIKVAPLDYFDFVRAMKASRFMITDSGGIQEEAAALGKYTVVVRNQTERQEAIDAGVAKLAPPGRLSVTLALEAAEREWSNVKPSDVFGDGHAAERIVDHLVRNVGLPHQGNSSGLCATNIG
jgi:UDP-N-acetylglucosamine 2-epimerase (non-hydrolysing)